MIELDNTMLLFIGSENYSGKKIPWTEMSVRVRFPPKAQKKYQYLLHVAKWLTLRSAKPLFVGSSPTMKSKLKN